MPGQPWPATVPTLSHPPAPNPDRLWAHATAPGTASPIPLAQELMVMGGSHFQGNSRSDAVCIVLRPLTLFELVPLHPSAC